MKCLKKIGISLAVASLFTGCAINDVQMNEKDFDYKKINKNKYNELPAIQEITTNDYVKKVEHLNHNITNSKIKMNFKEKSLDDVLKMLPLNYELDKEFKDVQIKQLTHNGDLVSFLDKVGEMTNLYWTYENETLKFSRTKIVVYKFPIFSAEKLNLIFNITSDSADQFNVSSIKTDVFDEIKTSLDSIMGEYLTEGSYEENVEKVNTVGLLTENNKNKSNKLQDLDKLVKTLQETQSNDLLDSNVDKISKNEQTTELSTLNNGFNRNNKDDGKATPVTPANQGTDAKKLLEYDIKKNNNKTGNNESVQGLLSSKEDNSKTQKLDGLENGKTNQNENIIEDILNNKDSNEDKNVTKIVSLYKKTINPERVNVSVLKESGMVVVNVDKSTERKIDTVLESITTNIMSNMILMDLYIVEVNTNKLKELKSTLARTKVNGSTVTNTSLDGTGMTFSKNAIGSALDSLGTVTSDGSIISGLINYTTENEKRKVLTNPKILSIPNIPARIKSSIDYPYLNIKSFGGTDTGPEMSIEFVNDGTDIALLTNVYGDDIFLSLGVKLNKYIGNQSLNAGTLGTFDVPIQSPRTLNTTFRMKAGEISIIGGMNSLTYAKNTDLQSGILPTNVGSSSKDSELLIIASPRLIKYVKPKQ